MFPPPMKNKLQRYYGRKELHFITFSCYQRRPFPSPLRAKTVFVKILRCRDRQKTSRVSPSSPVFQSVNMNATRSFFSWVVSFVPRIRLKNSTESSRVINRPS